MIYFLSSINLALIASVSLTILFFFVFKLFFKKKIQNEILSIDSETIERDFLYSSSIEIYSLNHEFMTKYDKLTLYSLYKQATIGDINVSIFYLLFDSKKYAWSKLKRLPQIMAKLYYINYTKKLRQRENIKIKNKVANNHNISIERNDWDKKNYSKKILKPIILNGTSSIFIDQLPDTLINEYVSLVKYKYDMASKGKPHYDVIAHRHPSFIKNEDFIKLFSSTHFSKLLYSFEEINKISLIHYIELFQLNIKENEYIFYLIADLTTIIKLPILPSDKTCIAPCVLLFKIDDNKLLNIISIAIKNQSIEELNNEENFPTTLNNMSLITKNDGLEWEVSKLHAVHNAHYCMSLGVHIQLHLCLSSPISILFEKLTLNGVIKLENSIISRILKTHSYLQTAVDCMALNSNDSILWNHDVTYSALNFEKDLEGEGVKSFIRIFTEGWENHPIYQSDIDLTQIKPHYNIGSFRKILFELKKIVNEFIDNLFKVLDNKEIEFSKMFLIELSKILPKKCIFKKNLNENFNVKEMIKIILSYFIHNGFHHSMDHALYEIDIIDNASLIIRQPVPFGNKTNNPIEMLNYIEKINTINDRSKYKIANPIFFHSHISKSFIEFVKEGGYFPKSNNGFLPKVNEGDKNDSLFDIQNNFFNDVFKLFMSFESPVDISMITISVQS